MGRKVFMFIQPTGLMDTDMVQGFTKLNIDLHTEIIKIRKTAEGHTAQLFSSKNITRILDTFKPEMIFSFNGFGLDNEGNLSHEYAKRGIPFVTWFVDKPRKVDFKNSYVKSNSYMFVFDRSYMALLKELDFDNIFYLPLATNPDRFRPLNDTAKEKNICFIGDSDYKTIRYLAANIDNMLGDSSDIFFEAVETAINKQGESVGVATRGVLKDVMNSFSIDFEAFPDIIKDMLEGFVEREASLRLRFEVIGRLARSFELVVHGDEIWTKIVGSGWKGKVNYFDDAVVRVYNRHAVHINISKFQLTQAVNQRPFDVSACESLLLTDERNDLRDLFAHDEIASYKNIEDLIYKAGYFLNNDVERKEMAKRARSRVLACHTYSHRADEIFRTVLS
ncbi:MAG TPA: glycosyltransferase [Anaerolineae bacterium]|nr:glycosyltransferase [Anaerolineae bacterium]